MRERIARGGVTRLQYFRGKTDVSIVRIVAALMAGTAAVAAVPAFAQDISDTATPQASAQIDTSKDTITVGAGIATVPSYEGSDHNKLIAAGAARGTIDHYAFSTRGTNLYVDLIRNPPGPVVDLQLGPIIGVNTNRSGGIHDEQVEALGTRKWAFQVGGYAGIGKTGIITSPYDKLSASVSYIHDVSGVYHSYLISPQIDYGTPLSTKAYVGLSANATYAGRGYARTYFDVDPAGSAASGLPVYYADKGWKDYSFSALANYSLTGNLLHGISVVGGVSYSRLLNDFAFSPVTRIAGSRSQWYGALGLAYTF